MQTKKSNIVWKSTKIVLIGRLSIFLIRRYEDVTRLRVKIEYEIMKILGMKKIAETTAGRSCASDYMILHRESDVANTVLLEQGALVLNQRR